jgi:hypothetical protein
MINEGLRDEHEATSTKQRAVSMDSAFNYYAALARNMLSCIATTNQINLARAYISILIEKNYWRYAVIGPTTTVKLICG